MASTSIPETLTFTTAKRKRRTQPVDVELCGERWTVQRPKDAVLYFAQTAIADLVGEADRASALLQFLNSVLEPVQRHRYFERCLDRDDPVDLQATLKLIGGLVDRWTNWPAAGNPEPVVIEPTDEDELTEQPAPVRVVNEDLGLEFEAHAPKDIILLIVTAALGTGANLGQQSWAIGLFLDASLRPADQLMISMRMRSTGDDLDLEDIAEIVSELAQKWAPAPTNRQERRKAARQTARKAAATRGGRGSGSTTRRRA
ncbi:MAG TPA: hypothetical protein VHH34_08945 [Pseudonocardiaceae bacterium]|nr:hypothetical protein [Pseudonocardiaceae bacterium]